MTPEEAIKIAIHCFGVQAEQEVCEECPVYLESGIACREVARVVISALEEIQQYREIGTVEECREARENQKPKAPIMKPYHVDIINSIPRYSSATPKRDMRKIKEIMREQEYDDAYTQNISQDFCEGWNTARSIIEGMLSDRYWRLKRQIPDQNN